MTEQWQENVYGSKPMVEQDKQDYTELDKIAGHIRKRDNFTCQSCRVRGKARELSVHHIVPRKQGGPTEARNLITLCRPCHNAIELDEVQSWDGILYYAKRKRVVFDVLDTELLIQLETERRARQPKKRKRKANKFTWQETVYGGRKEPH